MTDKNLTIRFTPDGFSYNDNDGFCEVSPGPDFFQRLCESLLEHVMPGQDADMMRCEVETTRLLLAPPHIEDEELLRDMFDITLSHSERPEQLITQVVELPKTQQAVKLCFAIDCELYHFMQRNYGDTLFCHPIAAMLTDADRMTQGNCLVAHCSQSFLMTALFRNSQLTLCNCFRTSQADTRSYYVMNTWVQQGLDQLQDYLLVLGKGNEALQVRASLHRYIKHVFS